MGLPIIQFPADLLALQEIIWDTRPDAIIETGLAWGGSAVFYASCLNNLGMPDDPTAPRRVYSIEQKVLDGVEKDIDDRLMELLYVESVRIEASSTEPTIAKMLATMTAGKRVMVCLDSRHTPEHVENEMALYADLVAEGCYLVVFDTFVDDMPAALYEGKECRPGNSPRQAVDDFLDKDGRFVVDYRIDNLTQISSNPRGYLRKIRD